MANNYYCHWNAANIFGKPKTNTDFLPYNGNGFKILIPSKWNPSKEVEYPGQVLRYEDNFDITTNVAVTVTKTDKKSITDFGSPEEFLSKVNLLISLFLPQASTNYMISCLNMVEDFPIGTTKSLVFGHEQYQNDGVNVAPMVYESAATVQL